MIHKKGVENINDVPLSGANHLDEPTKAKHEEYWMDNEVWELKIT